MSNPYDRFDAAFGRITAYAVLLNGKPVGRVAVKIGTAVTAYVQAWGNEMAIGRAGGGGYDRTSAAVQDAARKLRNDGANQDDDDEAAEALVKMRNALTRGRDGSHWTTQLEDAGFTLALVIG